MSSGGTNHTDDFAVVEFNCGIQPGLTTGLIPAGIGVQADYNGSNLTINGYDEVAPLPTVQPPGPRTYVAMSLIERSYPAGNVVYDFTTSYCAPTANVQLLHFADTTGAASGAGMIQVLFGSVGDPTWYWTGDHWGFPTGATTFNCARLLTWGSWGFIATGTTEW